jgi:hypothetical protein
LVDDYNVNNFNVDHDIVLKFLHINFDWVLDWDKYLDDNSRYGQLLNSSDTGNGNSNWHSDHDRRLIDHNNFPWGSRISWGVNCAGVTGRIHCAPAIAKAAIPSSSERSLK